MNAREYQEQAARTLISNDEAPRLNGEATRLVWNALGLAGEAGEFANMIKKLCFHGHTVDADALADELGDCLWYIAALCSGIGVPLDVVMERNLAKLRRRYPEGWDPVRSQQREAPDA